jgi:hypothetical protein
VEGDLNAHDVNASVEISSLNDF